MNSTTPAVRQLLAAFALLLCLSLGLQWAGGAYPSEFGAAADEPAHYVTGLLVRDYIAAGLPGKPMQFAERYYVHYPQVGIGHWPPAFYALEGGWMLIAGDSRSSVLILMAIITALVATLLAHEAWKQFGLLFGFTAGVLFVCLPRIQHHTAMTMVDLPVTLFSFAAILCLIRWLETDEWVGAIGFGVFAGIAILTKANALLLAAMPVSVVVLSGQVKRVRSGRFWAPAVIVALMCGPFYYLNWKLLKTGTEKFPMTVDRVVSGILPHTLIWPLVLTGVLFVLALIGLWVQFGSPLLNSKIKADWLVFGTYWLLVHGYHTVVPTSPDPRKMYMGVPVAILFAVAGVSWLGTLVKRPALVCAVVLAVFFALDFRIYHSPRTGLGQVATDLNTKPELRKTVYLVSSNWKGETDFVAEVAERDQRPNHIVLRAGKYLAKSTWSGLHYVSIYNSAETVAKTLSQIPVKVLVLHDARSGAPAPAHHLLLEQMVNQRPADWAQRVDVRNPVSGDRVRVYEYLHDAPLNETAIKIDMRDRLNSIIDLGTNQPASAK